MWQQGIPRTDAEAGPGPLWNSVPFPTGAAATLWQVRWDSPLALNSGSGEIDELGYEPHPPIVLQLGRFLSETCSGPAVRLFPPQEFNHVHGAHLPMGVGPCDLARLQPGTWPWSGLPSSLMGCRRELVAA